MIDVEHPLPAEAVAVGERGAEADLAPALPPQPRSVRDTGLEQALLVELVAKLVFIAGKSHLSLLGTKLRLSINVLREVLGFMVAEHLIEVAWRGESDIDVQYQLTAPGKARAAVYLERSPYVGPAPVTLAAYCAVVERQSWRQPQRARLGAGQIGAAFGEQRLGAGVLEMVGAAVYSGRSMLLYGPPGGGKTTLARRLGALLQGLVAVPYAVVVGQEIVQIHDPALHLEPTPQQAAGVRQALERRGSDIRWALCQRPLGQIGAELGADMLDLRHDAFGGCYQAPPHLKANNGIFIVDDLGRQRVAAAELLNRFMPPLDLGMDQLSLRGGHKFSVPFDALLVFATNLAPHALLDESFLRRLGYKIRVGALEQADYRALLRQQCRHFGIGYDEAAVAYLLDCLHGASGRPLLACYPRELLGRIADFAGFAGRPPCLSAGALEQAWHSMFAACDEAGPGPAAGAASDPASQFETIA